MPSSSRTAASEPPRVFAVDKPAGVTSHDVVAHVRRVLGGAKVGHAGTLDPQATGVLVLCVGAATKISAFLMEGEKGYEGVGRLGIETDTQDGAGSVVGERVVTCSPADLTAAAARYVGRIEQIPPMYSAVKISGRKLYKLARQGIEIERPPRPVTIHSFEIREIRLPDFDFHVSCSKGAYVRTLIHDLGAVLGCGGHLVSLRRVRQGGFGLEQCVAWEVLREADGPRAIQAAACSPEDALRFLPEIAVPAAAAPLRVGALLPATEEGPPREGLVRVLLGSGESRGIANIGYQRSVNANRSPGDNLVGLAKGDKLAIYDQHLSPPGLIWTDRPTSGTPAGRIVEQSDRRL